jgi:hypothetical protein
MASRLAAVRVSRVPAAAPFRDPRAGPLPDAGVAARLLRPLRPCVDFLAADVRFSVMTIYD